eukprot:CAMPEP_0175140068 /NCGR_PEP_ID=MMETSP0087-20121206/11259_1 /TAXON_ID=136419 /ORGANISM="Unknown Unknown, Strain D1" /LENGTH=816 /DNA_ID=CAMNT_0016423161 /DNA_START=101 /DNA_END=2552 /DNA_ORIENTATION=-
MGLRGYAILDNLSRSWGCFWFESAASNDVLFRPTGVLTGKQAARAFEGPFPALASNADFVLYIENKAGSDVRRPEVENFTYALEAAVYAYRADGTAVSAFESYYSLLRLKIPKIVLENSGIVLSGGNHSATIIGITITSRYDSSAAKLFSKYLSKQVDALKPRDKVDEITLTGIPAFIEPILDGAEQDLLHMDMIVMPLAMMVLASILRSLRLMAIPVLCIGCAITTTFLIMWGVALHMDVVAFVPSIMMSLMIAMSIDYSLFLLSRYREALQSGSDNTEAVTLMLQSGGHTILVSGATICVCFTGMLFFPLDMLQSFGLGSALSVSICLAVNITLTPAMLLKFPRFFAKCVSEQDILKQRAAQTSGGVRAVNTLTDSQDIILRAHPSRSETFSTCWWRCGSRMLHFPVNLAIVVTVVGMLVPIFTFSVGFPTTNTITDMLPRSTPATDALNRLDSTFGPGVLYPYRMLVTPPPGVPVMSDQYFRAAQWFVQGLSSAPGVLNTSVNDFTGVMVGLGLNLSVSEVANCLTNCSGEQLCPVMCNANKQFVSTVQNSSFLLMVPQFDPCGDHGDAWLKASRAYIATFEQLFPGYQVHIAGVAADTFDAVDAVYGALPTMLAITSAVVLVITAFAFKSVLVPLRGVFTIAVTLGFVYGFASLTYTHQPGAFDWLGLAGLKSQGALFWLVPVMTFAIIVGVGLDYDIFLLVRVKEFWDEGYPLKESVLAGLSKTGSIITAAGLIMAIAFSGLLFSSQAALNQLSFYLVFAVLFETFLVRPVLVPCVMDLFGEANFWPGKPKHSLASFRASLLDPRGVDVSY